MSNFPRRVIVVAYDGAEAVGITGPITGMGAVNFIARRPIYNWTIAAPGGGTVTSSAGVRIIADAALEDVQPEALDMLMVAGSVGFKDAMVDPGVIEHVARLGRHANRLFSICTGSALLAGAGLLDGHRVATLPVAHRLMQDRFPKVEWCTGSVWFEDRGVWTAGGTTATIDMLLSLIHHDVGLTLAREAAELMVVEAPTRGGDAHGRTAFSHLTTTQDVTVRTVIAYVLDHLDGDLSLSVLAAHAGMSERNLTRLFERDVALTPGRLVARARAEKAAELLTSTEWDLKRVAEEVGFRTAETLRKRFADVYGMPPAAYRETRKGPALNA